ncbi:MAG: DUF302 domain-containing protein [Candidatus Magasanikbacteria bacterium]|nr:DUF302 domain-containing protein [Candidatus Magasanikbacteria bacterium]
MPYCYQKSVPYQYQEALAKTKQALAAEGFGVLTEIDVKAALKAKLNADFDNYAILGACHPALAYQALNTEKTIGVLMPCNVIVYEDQGQVQVAAIRPTISLERINNPALLPLAQAAEAKLKQAIDNI